MNTRGILAVGIIVFCFVFPSRNIVFHNKNYSIVYLTLPLKNNIKKVYDRKAQKYRDLVSDILDNENIMWSDLIWSEIGSR